METPLNASSTTAGSLLGGGRFHVPQFQREYAWEKEEVTEFFRDLSKALNDDTYFLGLVIVTGHGQEKDVVDGQQRLLTLSLLAAALFHETERYERRALAERLQSTFLWSINFETDEQLPRITLSSAQDDGTLRDILSRPATEIVAVPDDGATVSAHLIEAYKLLSDLLKKDLTPDPFRRLGTWAEFLTNKLYFAVFVHPNPASAYRVFEVINTRGKELTTADLLKSYVLSQTSELHRQQRYDAWQAVARAFVDESPTTFVQYIRHAVTVRRGHVLPRDLYDVLTSRTGSKPPIAPDELVSLLQQDLDLYLQMADPTLDGPAPSEQLGVFAMLNALNVVSVRPIILAMSHTPRATEGMTELLRLTLQRIVVGNLGTGNVERRFGQVALRIHDEGAWEAPLASLDDLRPDADEFVERVARRSMNRNVLSVLRSAALQRSTTPNLEGYLYLIRPRTADWSVQDEDRAVYWVSTIGNTFLANESRRPMGSSTWEGFKRELLPQGVDGEWISKLDEFDEWGVAQIAELGEEIAAISRDVWYG